MTFFKKILIFTFAFTSAIFFYGSSFAQQDAWSPNQMPAFLISSDAEGNYIISNVRWGFDDSETFNGARFRTIKFNVNDIKDIYFATQPFPPEWLLTHSLMIFEFKDCVKTDKNEKSKAIVLSIEPRLRIGQYCDLIIKGNAGVFPIIYQLSSFEDYMQYGLNGIGRGGLGGKNFLVEKLIKRHKLYSYKLKLDKSQKINLLKYAVNESVADRGNEKYDTMNNSCTNNLFVLLNKVITNGRRYNEKIVRNIVYSLIIVKKLLKNIDIIDESMPVIRSGQFEERAVEPENFDGKTLESAQKNLREFSGMIAQIKKSIESAVFEGDITKNTLISIMYDEFSGYAGALYIPGVLPESAGGASCGEFSVGEEFVNTLNTLDSNEKIVNYISRTFDDYEKRLGERMAMGGPDISKPVRMKLILLKKSITEAIKYSKFNKNK